METVHRILVVEGDKDLRFLWRAALAKLPDVAIETAAYGQDALDRMRAEAFDLVVIDLKMPRMNGVELTRALRALDDAIAILWITEQDGIERMAAYHALQVSGYVDKPVTIQGLRRLVVTILAEQDAAAERSNEIVPGERVGIFPSRTRA